jgi:hypothetical protein
MIWAFRAAGLLTLFFWADMVAVVLLYCPALLLAIFLSGETRTVVVDRLK